MSKDFRESLHHHYWKGNIRELKNVMERAVILADTPELSINELPFEIRYGAALPPASSFDLAAVEKQHIQKVLNHVKGNKTEAARLLHIGLTTLYRKIQAYHLE